MRQQRWMFAVILGVLSSFTLGCGEAWHNLQPHRMHRLNRVPDGMKSNGYNFSIPSPELPDFEAMKESESKLSR